MSTLCARSPRGHPKFSLVYPDTTRENTRSRQAGAQLTSERRVLHLRLRDELVEVLPVATSSTATTYPSQPTLSMGTERQHALERAEVSEAQVPVNVRPTHTHPVQLTLTRSARRAKKRRKQRTGCW